MKTYLTRITIQPWLTAVVVMVVAAYASVTAKAQSSGDFIRIKYQKNSFDQLSWEQKRQKAHRRSDSPRLSPRNNAKSKAVKNKRTTSKKAAGPATARIA